MLNAYWFVLGSYLSEYWLRRFSWLIVISGGGNSITGPNFINARKSNICSRS
jgi:hypothetical protein